LRCPPPCCGEHAGREGVEAMAIKTVSAVAVLIVVSCLSVNR
jgi:hypothetical protein